MITAIKYQFSITFKQLETSIKVETNTISQRWKIKGLQILGTKKIDIRLVNITGANKRRTVQPQIEL
jgi:hypothetical protein